MGRDVVVRPTRSVPIQEMAVSLICKCGQDVREHPTAACKQFKGDRVKVK